MKKMLQWILLAVLAGSLGAQQPPVGAAPGVPSAAESPAGTLPDEIDPGYRKVESELSLGFNPFEPVEVKTDANSELSQAMLKRIKGYVVQSNGAPLLVIDGKSYRIRDKVPMNENAKSPATKDQKEAAAPVGGETVTIVNITPTEALFQKDDPSGFGGETFKIYFNFKHETDETGKQNYNLWEQVGNGFFINEEGVAVVPLSIAQGGDLSVMTPYGYSRATLVESDTRRGIGLLKVNVKSMPLYLSRKKAEVADAIFPVGYPLDKKAGLLFMEGFLKEEAAAGGRIAPELDGSLVGSAVLNTRAAVVGVMIGQTQTIGTMVPLSAEDAVFRKYAPSKEPEGSRTPTRATIEQSMVRVFRKK